jgi:tRNA(Ile)-lysidine synthase
MRTAGETGAAAFAAAHNMLPPGGVVLACVSGGADSMCMLDILLRLAPDFGYTAQAAHFNHMLRGGESDRDEAFVAEYCAGAGLRCHIGRGDVAARAARECTGIEETARAMRYAFFEDTAARCGARAIATAHTADDNAETVLLNLIRGTGARGLGGIPPVRGRVVRPLLRLTRRDVEAHLAARGVPHVEDSSNNSDDFARNRLRGAVMPALRAINPAAARNIMSASELLRSDDDFLRSEARNFISARPASGGRVSVKELMELHPAVSARVIRALAGAELSREHVRAVLRLCGRGLPSGEVCLPGGATVAREYEYIRFGGAERREGFESVELVPGVRTRLENTAIIVSCKTDVCRDIINKSLTIFMFAKSRVCGKLFVRPRMTGDSIRLLGAGGAAQKTKTLKKLFIERHIPARARAAIPVIADEIGPLAVYGVGPGVRCAPRPGDEVIVVELTADGNKM